MPRRKTVGGTKLLSKTWAKLILGKARRKPGMTGLPQQESKTPIFGWA
jgi:hypothetical protein